MARLFSTAFLLLVLVTYCNAQNSSGSVQKLSTAERLIKLEETLKRVRSQEVGIGMDLLRTAETELLEIRRSDPHLGSHPQLQADLEFLHENMANHDLQVAMFYTESKRSAAAVESRLTGIMKRYPRFSKMDEVLLRFALLKVNQKRFDDASRLFQELICKFPNSEYVDKAFEKLYEIGVTSWEGCWR